MESLKKVIPLSQAAKISGYHQDYLGFLVRKGELRARKVGRSWFTTEEEVRNYMFKQKVRQKEPAIAEFFSRGRTKKIVFIGLVLALFGLSLAAHFADTSAAGNSVPAVDTHLSTEGEIMVRVMQ